MKSQIKKQGDGIPDILKKLEQRVLKIESKISINITRLDENDEKIEELRNRFQSSLKMQEGQNFEQFEKKKKIMKKEERHSLEKDSASNSQSLQRIENEKATDIEQMIEFGKIQAEITERQNLDEMIKLFQKKFDRQKKQRQQYTKQFMVQILSKRTQLIKEERNFYQKKMDKIAELFETKIITSGKKEEDRMKKMEEKLTNTMNKKERKFLEEQIQKISEIIQEKWNECQKSIKNTANALEQRIDIRIKKQSQSYEEKINKLQKATQQKILIQRKKAQDEAEKFEQKMKNIIISEEKQFHSKRIDKIQKILEEKLLEQRKKIVEDLKNYFLNKQNSTQEQKMRKFVTIVDEKLMQLEKRTTEGGKKLEKLLVLKIKEEMDIIQKIQTQIHISNINTQQIFEKNMENIEKKEMKEILEWKEKKKLRFSEEKIRMDRIKHMVNENPEKSVDINSLTKIFKLEGSTITLQREIRNQQNQREYSHILLNTVIEKQSIFSFRVKVPRQRRILVGVVDRKTQILERNSFFSGNSIYYDCYQGQITYEKKHCRKYITNDIFKENMEMIVEVDMKKSVVTFTIKEVDKQPRSYRVYGEILSEPNRQFVPYFEMAEIGDSLTWWI